MTPLGVMSNNSYLNLFWKNLETHAAQTAIWTIIPKSTQLRIYGFDSYSHHLKNSKLFQYRDFSKDNSDYFSKSLPATTCQSVIK